MKDYLLIWCRHCCEIHNAKLIVDHSGVKHYDTDCGIMIFPDEDNIPRCLEDSAK